MNGSHPSLINGFSISKFPTFSYVCASRFLSLAYLLSKDRHVKGHHYLMSLGPFSLISWLSFTVFLVDVSYYYELCFLLSQRVLVRLKMEFIPLSENLTGNYRLLPHRRYFHLPLSRPRYPHHHSRHPKSLPRHITHRHHPSLQTQLILQRRTNLGEIHYHHQTLRPHHRDYHHDRAVNTFTTAQALAVEYDLLSSHLKYLLAWLSLGPL